MHAELDWDTHRWKQAVAHVALLLAACLFASGCAKRIDTLYGQRRGPGAEESVNGTGVLAEMFTRAGHKVFSWRRLSPRLSERADVIVWFPDDFEPPTPEARRWLEDWLIDEPGRTLIYVGRDFDAERWYWKKIQPDVPQAQQTELQRRLGEASGDFKIARTKIPASEDCQWFTVKGPYQNRDVRTLSGDPEWLRGVDPAKLDIELNGRMTPSTYAEVLLDSEGDMLVSREWFDESQLIVVTNGSFLLNLPLVNHEHRKLAGKLIDVVGPPSQTVVFLESYVGGPPISDDPSGGMPTGAEPFRRWPTNWILAHLLIVGIAFCFWRFPIFGRPRSPDPQGRSDFGRHIAAMAELLELTGDRVYAKTRLAQYRQQVKMKEKDKGGKRKAESGKR